MPQNDDKSNLVPEFDIKEKCKNFLEESGISFFIHARFLSNGMIISLPNNIEWAKGYFEMDYKVKSEIKLEEGIHLLDAINTFSKSIVMKDENFNIIKNKDGYFDVFGFLTHKKDTEILDIYLNKRKLLESFILHFIDKSKNIFNKCKDDINNLIVVRSIVSHVIFQNKKGNDISDNNFVKNLRQGVTFYVKNLGYLRLTKREVQVLFLILKGFTGKSMSVFLSVSSKTIEHHIASIKEKSKCRTKQDLFRLSEQMGIISYNFKYQNED